MQPLTTATGRLSPAGAPDPAVLTEIAQSFKMLGDPTRAALLYTLMSHGELTVSDLAHRVGVAEGTASQSLRVLRAHRIVRARRAGRHIHYRLLDEHIGDLLRVAHAHATHPSHPDPQVLGQRSL